MIHEFGFDRSGHSTELIETKEERHDRLFREGIIRDKQARALRKREIQKEQEFVLGSPLAQKLVENLELYLNDVKLGKKAVVSIKDEYRSQEMFIQFEVMYKNKVLRKSRITLYKDGEKVINAIDKLDFISLYDIPEIQSQSERILSILSEDARSGFRKRLSKYVRHVKRSAIRNTHTRVKQEAKYLLETSEFKADKEKCLEDFMRNRMHEIKRYVNWIPMEIMVRLVKELYVEEIMKV